jgi:alpha-methylacyl-CoA racemase
MLLTRPDGSPAPLPLADVRVLDLTMFGPGAFCAALLGDLGANVLTVERPDGGGSAMTTEELSRPNLWLQDARRRARRIGIDLKTLEGQGVLHRLAATADVVIEGFRPGVAQRLAADFATLSSLREGLVYCSISGYGQTGPHASRPGHDINYIATAGLLGLSGPPEGPPSLPGALIADFASGALFAASGILAALSGRHRTPEGCHVDVSLQEAVVQTMARFIVPYLEAGRTYRRGSSYLTGAVGWYNVHQTADDDGYVAVGAVEDSFFGNLCRLLERPDLEALRSDAAAEAKLSVELTRAMASRSRDELVGLLGEAACVSPVATIEEVVADPQLVHRGVFSANAAPGDVSGSSRLGAMARGGALRVDHSISADPTGRHTADVLAELGLDADEIARLRKEGHVG